MSGRAVLSHIRRHVETSSLHQFRPLLDGIAALLVYLNRSPRFLHAIAAVTLLCYAFLFVNLPTFVFPGAIHDDGLFISHAYSIASGQWLGPHSQFTLVKGPGYPLFLAALSLLRIPITLAHSVLWVAAAWLLAYSTFRITRSVLPAVLVLEVLVWNFGAHSMRVIRDEIVTPQMLLTFSLLVLALFVYERRGKMYCAILSGLVFGWLWTTREEIVVAVPALLILFGCAFQKAWKSKQQMRWSIQAAGLFCFSFAAVLGAIAMINLDVYGTFSVVDVNGPFKSALEEIESVQPDVFIPYTSVPQSAREKIYKISPTFAQLRPFLEGGSGESVVGWKAMGCRVYPGTCGEYATGWFMWALRDAVGMLGDYSNAHATAVFYGKVHDEVKRACDSGTVRCYHNPLPFMPHVNEAQWLQGLSSFRNAVQELTLAIPPTQLADTPSKGTDEQIRAACNFLGIDIHTPPPQEPDLMVNHRVVNFAIKKRARLIHVYAKWLPLLYVTGLCSAGLMVIRCLYKRSYPIELAIISAAWAAVVCRLIALTLVDISSFQAIFHMYIGYAFSFASYASLLSIGLLCRWSANGARATGAFSGEAWPRTMQTLRQLSD